MSKNYGTQMEGPFIGQRVPTLPVWTPADEGREIYTEDTRLRYYGTDTGWREYGAGGGGGSEFDMYADMLGRSIYLNCGWDGFLDESFVDLLNSTMTYDATDNKYTFTPGQVLQSLNFYDPLLGITITECMVYIDYDDTVSPTIEVTADGGANWETTANGGVHIFSNTGTDLRMRITGGGNGEVRSWGVFYNPDPTANQLLNVVPSGTVTMFAGIAAPPGWLLCDGSPYLVADYPELHSAIGYIWGGAGATFNVPDLRQRGPYGPGGGRAVGDTGGSETKDVSHTHSFDDGGHTHTIASDGDHTHDVTVYASDKTGVIVPHKPEPLTVFQDSISVDQDWAGLSKPGVFSGVGKIETSDVDGDHDHGGSTGSANASGTTDSGGSASQDVLNPIAVVNFIIKF